jgi:myo-inositol-1(or 4)-monophosphatase
MDTFIKQLAKTGGEIVGKKFGKIGVKYTKKDAKDVVTEADLAANKVITNAIKKKYPNHSIISEETGEEMTGSDYCWIIDPLDGTLNFATNVPLFGTMIGLAYKGEMILSAIYFPCTKEMLFAKRGKGAFLNGKRVHCSAQKKWNQSYGIFSVLLNVP